MATVYRIWTDDRYQSLEPVDMDAFLAARKRNWKFDGYPVDGDWKPLEMYVRRPTLLKPDIWGLANTLVFESEVARTVALCLDQAGEQFKLPFEGRKLIVLNVTYVIECLDTKKSDIHETLPHWIKKYEFYGNRLDNSLFKIPQTRMSEILTVEGLASPDDEFKPLVEKHGLKGLRFEKLWSDD